MRSLAAVVAQGERAVAAVAVVENSRAAEGTLEQVEAVWAKEDYTWAQGLVGTVSKERSTEPPGRTCRVADSSPEHSPVEVAVVLAAHSRDYTG